jgi:hypothetical protein
MSKVTRFPMNSDKRRKNRLGRFAVPCRVTDRWLQFAPTSRGDHRTQWMTIDVMTGGYDDGNRKICQLIITREDLDEVLERVKPQLG